MRVFPSVAVLLLATFPLPAGDVSGQVIITRKLARRGVAPTVYSLRGVATPEPPREPDAGNEFERTVVLLEGRALRPPQPSSAVIEQRNTRFEPDLVVIPVGSTVQFPNFDPIFHNVFSLSSAQSFDLGYYAKSQSRSITFKRAGVVQVYCHIHSHMYAGIVVTDTPFSVIPDRSGAFSFADVPAGHYRLLAWHKIAGLHKIEVDVPASGVAHVKIRVPVDMER